MIIALCGPAGCGKSTIARELSRVMGGPILSFAQPMRHMIEELLAYFGYDEDERCKILYSQEGKARPLINLPGAPTARRLLQTLGTEWGRGCVHPDIWVAAALRTAGMFDVAIFDDCRFDNEAEAVRAGRGRVVHLRRQSSIEIPHHASEAGVFASSADIHVVNDRDPEIVAAAIKATLGL